MSDHGFFSSTHLLIWHATPDGELIVHWKYMNTKKARLIKTVIQAIVVVALGYVVRHKLAETHAPVWVAAGWLLTAWVVLRLAMALNRGYANFRTHTATGVNLENLDKLTTASMQPWARGYYQIEKMVYRGTWRSITRKPLTPAGEFSVAGGPNGKRLAAGLLLLLVAGALVGAVFLPSLVLKFWPRVFAFAGAGWAVLYAAIWIIGDRRNLKEGGHGITCDALTIDLGIRCSGTVALSDVAACGVLGASAWPIASSDVWLVSPGEPANVLVDLNGPTTLAITAFGSPRQIDKRFIALYVDQPAAFVDALSRASVGGLRAAAA